MWTTAWVHHLAVLATYVATYAWVHHLAVVATYVGWRCCDFVCGGLQGSERLGYVRLVYMGGTLGLPFFLTSDYDGLLIFT